jgi:hypothetical protein
MPILPLASAALFPFVVGVSHQDLQATMEVTWKAEIIVTLVMLKLEKKRKRLTQDGEAVQKSSYHFSPNFSCH